MEKYKRKQTSLLLFSVFLVLFLWNGSSFAQKQVVATVDGDPMYQVLPANTIPANHNPTFVRGKQADKQMSDKEPGGMVFGL